MRIPDQTLETAILDQAYRLGVLERVVELITQRLPSIGGVISSAEMQVIRRDVVIDLQRRFPQVPIKLEDV